MFKGYSFAPCTELAGVTAANSRSARSRGITPFPRSHPCRNCICSVMWGEELWVDVDIERQRCQAAIDVTEYDFFRWLLSSPPNARRRCGGSSG